MMHRLFSVIAFSCLSLLAISQESTPQSVHVSVSLDGGLPILKLSDAYLSGYGISLAILKPLAAIDDKLIGLVESGVMRHEAREDDIVDGLTIRLNGGIRYAISDIDKGLYVAKDFGLIYTDLVPSEGEFTLALTGRERNMKLEQSTGIGYRFARALDIGLEYRAFYTLAGVRSMLGFHIGFTL